MVTTEAPRPLETTVTVLMPELVLPLVGETPYQDSFFADVAGLKLTQGEKASPEAVLRKFTESGFNYPEFTYYIEHLDMLEETYLNKWVGITADGVVAYDPFESVVQIELKEAKIEKALVFWVAKNSQE